MNRKWAIIGGILAFLVAILLIFVYFQSVQKEGAWVCQNGEWVKQGEPRGAKPTWECQEGEKVADSERESLDQAKFERSQELARKAVENSATYQYDGFDLKFESAEKLACLNCWEFTYSFSSRHAGYGDRSGQMLAQVITPHQTRVSVENEEVFAVVTDRTFDELKGIYLK